MARAPPRGRVTLRAITREEYDALAELVPYFAKRWGYLSRAGEMLRELGPLERGLEIGPGPTEGESFLRGGQTLDMRGAPTIRHDAGVVPWPIADNAYDIVVALQVWEHLEGRQRDAFRECLRVARFVMLSFPYRWKTKNETHRMITRAKIEEWTCSVPPMRTVLVRDPPHRMRLVCLWRAR